MKTALRVALVFSLVAAAASAATLPKPAHIVIVFEENKNFTQVIGSKNAPYINGTLLPMGTSMGKFYSFHHPSQPNYMELFAGTIDLTVGGKPYHVCGVHADHCLPQKSTTPNLYTSIAAGKLTFGGYAEDLPALAGKKLSDYYDLLRTITDMYGLTPVGNSATLGHDITDIWK